MTTSFDRVKTYLFKQYSGDAGKMLLHTGTAAWIFSAMAQIAAIVWNDKVSKDQKKFMIPQEFADAAINIASFYLVTNSVQNLTKKLASSGKIITPAIKKFCEKHKIAIGKDANIGKAILDKVKNLETTIGIGKERKILTNSANVEKTFNAEISELNNFYDKQYAPFESGLKVVGNVIGAVVSSNIITPILRNPIAAYKQKQDLEREKFKNMEIPAAPRIILGQNEVDKDTKTKLASVNPTPRITTGGGMKI